MQQGDYNRVSHYDADPVELAIRLVEEGARRLHVVDLDGARLGSPCNYSAILTLAQALQPASCSLQVGGGIRTVEQARLYLDNGVDRIVLGTAAVETPDLISALVQRYEPRRLAISLDLAGSFPAIRGWTETASLSAGELFSGLRQAGVSVFVITDTRRDGMLTGPNLELVRPFVQPGLEIIVAGGVSRYRDLLELKRLGVAGVIIGKALYENRLQLRQCLDVIRERSDLSRRIIPCLDVKDGRVVKGTHFRNLRDAGDPLELGRRYSEDGADELVFLDITATVEGRKAWLQLISRLARHLTIPFTVGGGISTLADINALLCAGADKVSLGTAAVLNPELVAQAARQFGSQCLVVSVDARRRNDSWICYIRGGTQPTGTDAVQFAARMARLGAGELLVNSLDRDGTGQGYDLGLLTAICQTVNIPVIASSGAGTIEDFVQVLTLTPVDAVLAASVFHYELISIRKLKEVLCAHGIPVRQCDCET